MSSEPTTLSVGDVVSLQRGSTYKSALLGLPGPVLLGLGTIQRNGGFRGDSLKTYGGDSPEKLLVGPGELYVSLKDVTQSGDLLGAVARAPRTFSLGRLTQDTVKLVVENDEYPQTLLYWTLRTPEYRDYCRERGTGTTNLALGRTDFLAFPLPRPTALRMTLIDVLEGIEDRITLLRETNATLEAIAQAVFKSWFVDFDPVRAKQEGRFPEGMDEATAALFPDGFEESELGLVPRGWGPHRLDSVLELAYGKALKADARTPGDVPVYGSGGITGWHDVPLISHASIVVGRKGTVGSLYWESRPFFPIDTVFYVKTSKPLSYIYYLLQTLGLSEMNTDAAVPGLNRENVYRLKVAGPPPEVVAAFDELVRHLRASIDQNMSQTQTVATLRDTLLPRLISGQLRIPNAEALAV